MFEIIAGKELEGGACEEPVSRRFNQRAHKSLKAAKRMLTSEVLLEYVEGPTLAETHSKEALEDRVGML